MFNVNIKNIDIISLFLFNLTIPYARGAPFGASSTRANKVLKAHLVLWVGNLAYLVFCSLLQKTNVLNYAIEITALSKPIRQFGFRTQVYRV